MYEVKTWTKGYRFICYDLLIYLGIIGIGVSNSHAKFLASL
ncbi:MAG: hypothetical protein WCD89_26730 [Anaerocolumna sp.]